MPGDELEATKVTDMLKNLFSVSKKERLFCLYCEVRLHNDSLDYGFQIVVLCILLKIILMEELHFACTAHNSSGPSLVFSPYSSF